MVFYNTKYPDISAAIQQSDGLLVIGVMAQVIYKNVCLCRPITLYQTISPAWIKATRISIH